MSSELLGIGWGEASSEYPEIAQAITAELDDIEFGFRELGRFKKALTSRPDTREQRLVEVFLSNLHEQMTILPDNGHLYVKVTASKKGDTIVMVTFSGIGGTFTTGSMVSIGGLGIARVGDVVTYAGGSEAVVTDGAGAARVIGNRPAALVGSSLSNGDRIIETPWQSLRMTLFVPDGKVIPNLFDAAWTPPSRGPDHRFVVRGSTGNRNEFTAWLISH